MGYRQWRTRLGGRDVATTNRAANVRRGSWVAVVIDGVDTSEAWRPWAFIVRGSAEMDDAAGAIRVRPTEITSWGLD